MSRDPGEGYQPLDDDQSISATAGGPFIPSMSLAVVIPRPVVKAGKKGLNELSDTIVKFKFCRFLDKEGYLTDSDIFALSAVSKTTQGLFQPNRLQMLVDKLLLQVMRGDQTNAEVILKIRPDLLLIKGTATDYSGRTFECTAFQYALWALDTRYMCPMMLNCLPFNSEGEHIKQALLRQFLEVESDGIEYQLESKTVREKHYNFTPLLIAIKTYVDYFEGWFNYRNWGAMINQWSKVVGLAQRYVPAHVAQHYCDPDKPFFPTPTFNAPKFSRVLQFYHYDYYATKTKSHWFSPDIPSANGLGVDFGISRAKGKKGKGRRACGAAGPSYAGDGRMHAEIDLLALKALCQVRTKDLEPLKERLLSPLLKPSAAAASSRCVIC